MQEESARLLQKLRAYFPIPLGSLRVYGDWFGGRQDNWHTAVDGQVDDDGNLVLQFNEQERLLVVEPRGCTFELRGDGSGWLRIERAQTVRWEWYYYGRARTRENLFVEEHWIADNEVHARTTWPQRNFAPSLLEPAVEFR